MSSTPLGDRYELDNSDSPHVQQRLQAAVDDAIRIEGPIELSRLTRGIVRRFGFDRAKANRQEVVRALVPNHLIRSDEFGTFVWPSDLDPSTWRGVRQTPSGLARPLDEIAAEELINALAHVARGRNIELEVLMRDTLAIFDQRRLTRQATDRLESCIIRAEASGRLVRVGARYSASE